MFRYELFTIADAGICGQEHELPDSLLIGNPLQGPLPEVPNQHQIPARGSNIPTSRVFDS